MNSFHFFPPKSSPNWWTQERNHSHPILHTNEVIPKDQSVLEKMQTPAILQWRVHPGADWPYGIIQGGKNIFYVNCAFIFRGMSDRKTNHNFQHFKNIQMLHIFGQLCLICRQIVSWKLRLAKFLLIKCFVTDGKYTHRFVFTA